MIKQRHSISNPETNNSLSVAVNRISPLLVRDTKDSNDISGKRNKDWHQTAINFSIFSEQIKRLETLSERVKQKKKENPKITKKIQSFFTKMGIKDQTVKELLTSIS